MLYITHNSNTPKNVILPNRKQKKKMLFAFDEKTEEKEEKRRNSPRVEDSILFRTFREGQTFPVDLNCAK